MKNNSSIIIIKIIDKKMTEYFLGMVWLDWKYLIPEDPKEALTYIKEMRKPAIERTIELMKDSDFYFKMKNLEMIN